MKAITILGVQFNIVPDEGKSESCNLCDLFEECTSFNRYLHKALCDTPTGGTGYFHFERLKENNNDKTTND